MSRHAALRPLIFGEVLFDRFADGSAVLGGAPFNVAWHLQAFGAAPLMITRVGQDALGDAVLAAMQAWGMDERGVQRDPLHPTGTVEVRLIDGEPHYDIVTARAYDFIDAAELPELFGDWLLYHGSLGLRSDASRAALQALRARNGGRVFFDVNLRAPWWQRAALQPWLQQANWIKLNDDEWQALAPPGAAEAQALMYPHTEYCVLTRGAAGAHLTTRDGTQHAVRPEGRLTVVDTVGAGDAFCSVLLLGLLRQWPLPLAMQRAQQFASAVVGLRGAITQDARFYQPFLAEWGL